MQITVHQNFNTYTHVVVLNIGDQDFAMIEEYHSDNNLIVSNLRGDANV